MSCPATVVAFINRFFRERYIFLREDWLQAALDYLSTKNLRSDSSKLAALVFEQWKFSNFRESSEPVFSKLGLLPTSKKAVLKNPIVCQIHCIIDVGTSYYSQFSRLSSTSRVDNTGFEAVFNKEENDNDEKSSRMLRLTLDDGESQLKAIELVRIPKLSLYIKPGCKILISPPLTLRKGTFLLLPENCQVLGGECLPQLNSERPLDKYREILGLQEKMVPRKKEEPQVGARQRSSLIKASAEPNQTRNYSSSPSRITFNDDDVVDLSDDEEGFLFSPSPKKLPSRMEKELIDKPTKRRAVENVVKTPKRRVEFTEKQRPVNGMLSTSRPQSSFENSPLKADEEPLNLTNLNMYKVKKEKSDDSDIEIIELDPPLLKTVKKEIKQKVVKLSPEELIIKKFKALENVSIEEIMKRMRFCVGSRRVNIVGSIEKVLDPLRIVDGLWTMKVSLRDDSKSVESLIDNNCLEILIGMSCAEALAVRQSTDIERRKNGAKRLKGTEQQLQRLDLLFEVEFFNDRSLSPVIRSVRTMAEVLDVF
ncbi:unnamed protein product [Caenorhabditis auriculariae]|uniref:RecQ-mediated genome instability protein 1 n=1 Tax=Caenorhabditis auriculariae TaxID=2777116 RepID=A0A8S1H138_9PELO|nr:unnamed protein product [Caenorhabditis auriculariae]